MRLHVLLSLCKERGDSAQNGNKDQNISQHLTMLASLTAIYDCTRSLESKVEKEEDEEGHPRLQCTGLFILDSALSLSGKKK